MSSAKTDTEMATEFLRGVGQVLREQADAFDNSAQSLKGAPEEQSAQLVSVTLMSAVGILELLKAMLLRGMAEEMENNVIADRLGELMGRTKVAK